MICEDCGDDFEMWMTSNEEWQKVVEDKDVYSYLCIECFKNKAKNKNIMIDTNKIEIFNKLNPFN